MADKAFTTFWFIANLPFHFSTAPDVETVELATLALDLVFYKIDVSHQGKKKIVLILPRACLAQALRVDDKDVLAALPAVIVQLLLHIDGIDEGMENVVQMLWR